jgi:hypothetical protein
LRTYSKEDQMRKLLASAEGTRKRFRATFIRFGRKTNFHGYSDQTLLLKKVLEVETNTILTDHIWFSYTKGFEKVNLQPGTVVEFEARIKVYTKGYLNRTRRMDNRKTDYRLSHPTRISIVSGSQWNR